MKKYINIIIGLLLVSSMTVYSQVNDGNKESSNFKIGFAERFRMVTWDNAITLSEAAQAGNSFTRIRTNIFGSWMPAANWELNFKITNEFRSYFLPQREFDMNEIFIDQLFVKYKSDFGDVTLGRQNLILGEGFVVMDGHPLDGSRSIYFNAARFDWNINKSNKLTAFYTYVPETDNILPVINDFKQRLLEQPEQGIGFYYTGCINSLNLQGYFINKKILEGDNFLTESTINSIGGRVQLPVGNQLKLTVEAAYQTGSIGDFDRSAFGGYAYASYKTNFDKVFLPVTATVGGIYLSGDDPDTKDVEGWDPLFSRWPKWSESYIYTLIIENGGKVGYWSNFASLYAKFNFNLMEDLKFNLDYHFMLAPENAVAGNFPGGTGNTRGNLIIGKLVYIINKNLTGHLLFEHFDPGDYYFDGSDGYNWARIEFMFKI